MNDKDAQMPFRLVQNQKKRNSYAAVGGWKISWSGGV